MDEIKVLCRFVQEHKIADKYQLMTVKPKDIRVGDIVTIAPACYDDLGYKAQFVDKIKVGKYLVINGFVFDPEADEPIMRRI